MRIYHNKLRSQFGGNHISRVILQELPEYKFKFIRTIQKSDLNYASHLGNDNLVSIIQETRIDLFQKLGYSELDLGDGRTGIIIGDLVVNFKGEAFESDELLIESQIGDVTEKSMRLYHRVSKTNDNTLIALVETGLVAFDYTARGIAKWPDELKKGIKKLIK